MFEEEVENGAKWLDHVKPGWEESIDINNLFLGSYERCTLGQVFSEQCSKNLCGDLEFSRAHGFSIPFIQPKRRLFFKIKTSKDIIERYYHILSAAWIKLILNRRALKNLQTEAIEKVKVKQED